MSLTPEEIDRGLKLLKVAKSGPWFVSGVRFRMDRGQWHAVNRYNEEIKEDENVCCVGYDPRTDEGKAEAELIVWMRNNIEALLRANVKETQ